MTPEKTLGQGADMTDLRTKYLHEEVIATRRILRYLAERQPLMYLAWLERAGRVHVPCDVPDCLICARIHEIVIPLPQDLVT